MTAKKYLVVPTNRPESLARFLREWGDKGGWDDVIVVEDAPGRSAVVTEALSRHTPPLPRVRAGGHYPGRYLHYSHAEIAAELGTDAWVISRGSSACRSFGFLKAWWEGADYVLTLDDDCYQCLESDQPVFDRHVARLERWPKWRSTVDGLDVRGLPEARGNRADVVMNVGLWTGCPDLDAKTQLAGGAGGGFGFVPPPGNWLAASGQYVPVSGMNLCVARQAIPLMYFAPMGEGLPYHRFDDIWMGVIAKKVCDLLGLQVSVGEPFVRHERASDPYQNLALEAPGLEENERFWRRIDRFDQDVQNVCDASGDNPTWGMMREMGHYMRASADVWDWPYAYRYGQAIGTWCRLLDRGPGPTAMRAESLSKEVQS